MKHVAHVTDQTRAVAECARLIAELVERDVAVRHVACMTLIKHVAHVTDERRLSGGHTKRLSEE